MLPAIVADPDANPDAGRVDADASARTVIIIPIASAIVITLAGSITIGIADDHPAAAVRAIATAAVLTDDANLLHGIRGDVFAGGENISGLGAADSQGADTSQ